MASTFLKQVQNYVLSLLTARTPVENFYHDVSHTKGVVESAVEIGTAEKLTKDELEIVEIAAWFHDVGYIERTKGHERISVNYSKFFLESIGYPSEKIKTVLQCIRATKIPAKPKTKLQKIVCDADLNHFGRKTFLILNEKYRIEFENYLGRSLSETEWLEKTIDFLKKHRFFTSYCRKYFSSQKKKNLDTIKKSLQKSLKQS